MVDTADIVILGPGEGRSIPFGSRNVTVKADVAADAHFAVFESAPLPGQPGPVAHVHRQYDEAFYVLAGVMEFRLGERTVTLGSGSFVQVPRGIAHTFRNPGPGAARMLVIVAPPAALTMMDELSALTPADGRPEVEQLRAMYAAHQTDIVGPPRTP